MKWQKALRYFWQSTVWIVIGGLLAAACGDGGVDIGSSAVEVGILTTDPGYRVAGETDDIEATLAILRLNSVQYGVSRSCGKSDQPAEKIEVITIAHQAAIFMPEGTVLPPIGENEVSGYYLCWVALSMRATETAPALRISGLTPTGALATYLSDRPFLLQAILDTPAVLEDSENIALEFGFGLDQWLTGIRNWNSDTVPLMWTGGVRDEITVRGNIANSAVGSVVVQDLNGDLVEYGLSFQDRSFADENTAAIDAETIESIVDFGDENLE